MANYKKMDGSQLWDSLVGSQTCEDFMEYSPNQTVEEAVEEYISNENLRVMFPYDWEEQDEETLEYMREQIVRFIETMIK